MYICADNSTLNEIEGMPKYDIQKNPQLTEAEKVSYSVRLVPSGKLTTRELAERIAGMCTISVPDLVGTLTALSQIFTKELANGRIIQLDGIGSFRIGIHAPSAEEPTAIRANDIEVRKIIFTPERKMISSLKRTKFERTDGSTMSANLTDEEIDSLLHNYFQKNEFITVAVMQQLCKFSNATARRRLQERVANGLLRHPAGMARSPLYLPMSGHYGKD